MSERVGIVVVSYCLLEQMLHLPEGHRIIGLRQTDTFSDTFEIAVEGQPIERVRYEISVTEEAELVRKRTFVGKFEETRA